jgi:Tfp pilus assembly protein PilF
MSLILQALKKAKDLTARKATPAQTTAPAALASFRFGRRSKTEQVKRILLRFVLLSLALAGILGYTVNWWVQRSRPRSGIVINVPPVERVGEQPAAPPSGSPETATERQQPPVPAAAQQQATQQEPPAQSPPLQPPPTQPAPVQPARQQQLAVLPRAAVQQTQQLPPAVPPRAEPRPPITGERPGATAPAEPPRTVAPPAEPPPVKAQQQPSGIQVVPASRNLFELAVFYQRSKDFVKAFEMYRKVLEQDPLNAAAYNNMGLLHQEMGNNSDAIRAFRNAILIDENYDKAHNNLGSVLMNAGQDSEALREVNRALQLNPKNAEAMINLAVLTKRSGNVEQAKIHYLRALQINPTNAVAHYNLALLFEEQGENSSAVEHFREFLKAGSGSYPDVARDVEIKINELLRRE